MKGSLKVPRISESKLQEMLAEGQLDFFASVVNGPFNRTVLLKDECYDVIRKFEVISEAHPIGKADLRNWEEWSGAGRG